MRKSILQLSVGLMACGGMVVQAETLETLHDRTTDTVIGMSMFEGVELADDFNVTHADGWRIIQVTFDLSGTSESELTLRFHSNDCEGDVPAETALCSYSFSDVNDMTTVDLVPHCLLPQGVYWVSLIRGPGDSIAWRVGDSTAAAGTTNAKLRGGDFDLCDSSDWVEIASCVSASGLEQLGFSLTGIAGDSDPLFFDRFESM